MSRGMGGAKGVTSTLDVVGDPWGRAAGEGWDGELPEMTCHGIPLLYYLVSGAVSVPAPLLPPLLHSASPKKALGAQALESGIYFGARERPQGDSGGGGEGSFPESSW